jgi:hypothetical protein
MKKLFVLTVLVALVLAGCWVFSDDSPDDKPVPPTEKTTLKISNLSFTDITNVIWQGNSFNESTTENSIRRGATVTKEVQPDSGYIYFTRSTNFIKARTSALVIIRKDEQKEFIFLDDTVIVDADNPNNTGTLGSLQPLSTTLKIKNESFTDITDVIWQSVSFAESQTENSIRKGATVTETVQPGSGYIYFTRSTIPISARTNDLVVITKDEQKEFIFFDDTVIVDVDNPNNTGTLSSLQQLRTTLKIKNESFTDITDVIWQGVSFAENPTENTIKKGATVTKIVEPSYGYIYFKRSINPINARTNELVVITKNEQKEFIFLDDTVIVDIDNPSNTGTLVSLQPIRTTLRIQNESFSEITDVLWYNVPFTQGAESIKNGTSVTKTVQEGEGYIFFKRVSNPINARTAELVKVEKDELKEIVIIDNTPIVDVDNPENKGTFGTLGVTREPQITVQAGTTSIAQYGDYDFGSKLLDTDNDVTFTIGNSGNADLKFNVIEGNVINLSGNTDGYFSVNQQPFATMIIAPGTTTTFIIRFSPKDIGNNYNAEVTIATNSEYDKEFTFRVKGNGSKEYKIGDTGPGGGIVFFAEGGQYKECSGELGAYSWAEAVNQAKNHKGGGFNNWRLPDRGELDLMYRSRTAIGGFSSAAYWSSTEYSSNYAWCQSFSYGNKGTDNKSSSNRVRAVRDFNL